jgi:hypothetical protein
MKVKNKKNKIKKVIRKPADYSTLGSLLDWNFMFVIFVIVFVIFVLCIVLSVCYFVFFVYCSTTATEYIPTRS